MSADLEAEVMRVAAELRAKGEWVSFNYRVKPHVAAALLGITPDALKKRRSRAKPGNVKPPIPYFNGRAVTYFIAECLPQRFDIAA